MSDKPKVGTIVWTDLTIPNATEVRDFYKAVVGWEALEIPMGDHSDFSMTVPGGEAPVAGVCHALGDNKDLPPQWMIYVLVEDLDKSLETCQNLGGKAITAIRQAGDDRFCAIQDPAGAVMTLYQKG